MFSLIYGFYQYLTEKVEYNVLMLGVERAGKTTALENLKSKYLPKHHFAPESVSKTIGLNIGRFEEGGFKLTFRDLGGMEDLRPIWEKYYPETHAVMFMFDASDNARLDDSGAVLSSLLALPALNGVPFLICANKWDMMQGSQADSEAFARDVLGLRTSELQGRPLTIMPTSSLSGHGLTDCVQWLVGVLKQRHEPSR